MTAAALTSVAARTVRSTRRSAEPGGRAIAPEAMEAGTGVASTRLPDIVQRLEIRGHDALRKRDVAHLLAHLLAVVEAVADDVFHRGRGLGVSVLFVGQQPCVGHDR